MNFKDRIVTRVVVSVGSIAVFVSIVGAGKKWG